MAEYAHWEELPSRPSCQYGVASTTPSGVEDCGDVADFRVWWMDDESDALYVCEEHFNVIIDGEAEEESDG